MDISFLNKSRSIQPQQVRDAATDPGKDVPSEENKTTIHKNKVDTSEISSSHSGSYEDKRLSVAKSSILHDATASDSAARIQQLKEAIDNNTYDVPANLLADAMLKD